jgi:hypothetical protein
VTGIGPLKNSKGTLITENSEMAEELNKFFTSVFTKDSSDHIPYLSEILEQSTDLLTLSEKIFLTQNNTHLLRIEKTRHRKTPPTPTGVGVRNESIILILA